MAQPPRPPASIRQRPHWGLALKTTGLIALVLGTTFGGIGYAALRSGGSRSVAPIHPLVAVVLMFVLLGFGRWAYRHGSRHRARLMDPLTDLAEAEPIVLLLRSFDEDAGLARVQGGDLRGPWAADLTTEEQQLGNATATFGRLVALGSPRDTLPQVGAGRDYAGDDEWRSRVLAGLDRAQLVLLVASPGEAIRWETEQVVERGLADRLVVLVTGDGQRYERFRAELSAVFPRELPPYQPLPRPSNTTIRASHLQAVVWFDPDWTPHLVPLGDDQDHRWPLVKLHRWVETTVPLAIWPLYGRAGVPVPGLPSEPRRRPWAVPAALALAAPAAVTVAVLLISSAVDGNVWEGVIAGVGLPLLALLGHRVWHGGYLAVRAAAFLAVLVGVLAVLLLLASLFLRDGVGHWWPISAGLYLLAAGLLLAGRSVRDWTAALVLFPSRTADDGGPADAAQPPGPR
ncbi:hypothetical protein QQG74_14170 [Micromonospora sp. FIMYZ51]|uniref:hypothetical protein n=1 Tax=Micromonospora sp. FIMYZ51 TaxID=3051832 RepID=UPI00311E6EF7